MFYASILGTRIVVAGGDTNGGLVTFQYKDGPLPDYRDVFNRKITPEDIQYKRVCDEIVI
jgi:hypothetical protein